MSAESVSKAVDVVVVGAGFAGMYALYRLRKLGYTVRVFEAGDDVGGTWYWNRYPGARCDVDSMSYSYSFSPELEQEWVWSEKYPTQPEILRYANHVADRFDLRRGITFNTRVTAAHWDEKTLQWNVVTAAGETVQARFVIMATGCLSKPKMLDIPGADRFEGSTYHTSSWPHEGVDFTGKVVGVIGTGSSGIQSIPLIAKQAKDLTVFQRTAVYTLPALNRPLEEEEVRTRKADYRKYRQAQRDSYFGVPVDTPPGASALSVSEQERNTVYERHWGAGTLMAMFMSYNDLLRDRKANETAAEFARSKIRSIVRDPKTAELLSPRTFPFGAKRLCLDTDYYKTFNEPHVHLVDLRTTPLVEVTAKGVRTTEREYPLDALVFATGFDALTGALLAIDIRGVGGLPLREKWAAGPRAYLGIGVAGFPNLFTVTGPSSPSVLSNVIVSIEQHVDWIVDCLVMLQQRGARGIEAAEEAEDTWARHVADVGGQTLYTVADSWYMGANVPGKPRVLLAYLGGVDVYRGICDQVVAKGYEGFRLIESAH
jgi:cyclohexanone monooxygenase